uniref:Uncharacterized protein n=1 Tax=viral metagenome TaxID=1070528 RepID=A0A6M3K6U2_9ZZZZ
MAEKNETIGQYLERQANGRATTEADDLIMAGICRRMGFPKTVVTCGIVYLEGRGTIDFPPMPICQVAGMLVAAKEAKLPTI